MPTQLYFNNTQEKLLKGVDAVAKAVTVTLGPKGQNVLIARPYGAPAVVHDGVSVAKSIHLEDEAENQGAMLVVQAADKTNSETGDGTTTTVLLTHEFVKEGIKLAAAGMNVMDIRKGMEAARDEALEKLQNFSRPIEEADWKDIATISAQDEKIGTKIAEAFQKVGKNGSIEVEQGANEQIDVQYQDGMSIEKGWFSHFLITDFGRMQAVYTDANILITDRPINSMQDLRYIAAAWDNSKKPLLIIAENFSIEVTQLIIQNKMKSGVLWLLVQAPEFGDRKKQLLEDIAIATNAKYFSSDMGMELKDITPQDFGTAKKIVSDRYSTLILASGDEQMVADRVKGIEEQIEHEDNDFAKEFLQKRIAKLTGGIAMIYAGGKTDVEAQEVTERIRDAVGATRSAIEEGVSVGGGTVFYQLSKELNVGKLTNDFAAGYELVRKSLAKPLERLLQNSGENPGYVMHDIDQMNGETKSLAYGYNAYTGKVENLEKAKVLDPTKVLRVSIENAVSVAGSIISAACLVVDKPVEDKQ